MSDTPNNILADIRSMPDFPATSRHMVCWVLWGSAVLILAAIAMGAISSGYFSTTLLVLPGILVALAEAAGFASTSVIDNEAAEETAEEEDEQEEDDDDDDDDDDDEEGERMVDIDQRIPKSSNLGRVAVWLFGGFGALMVVGGVIMTFSDPAGLALVGFGAVFIAVALFAHFVIVPSMTRFAAQMQNKTTIVTSDIRTRKGHKLTGVTVDKDSDLSPEEQLAQRRLKGWQKHPDWVRGVINDFGAGFAGVVQRAATVFCVAAVVAVLLALWLGGIFWWAVVVSTGTAVLLVGWLVHGHWQQRKFGASTLALEQTPALLGETLRATLRTGMPRDNADALTFELTLECLSNRAHALNIKLLPTQKAPKPVWSTTATAQAQADAGNSEQMLVPVLFELPEDQPETDLFNHQKYEGVGWFLKVHASAEGLDYRGTFEVPVLMRAHDPTAGVAAPEVAAQ